MCIGCISAECIWILFGSDTVSLPTSDTKAILMVWNYFYFDWPLKDRHHDCIKKNSFAWLCCLSVVSWQHQAAVICKGRGRLPQNPHQSSRKGREYPRPDSSLSYARSFCDSSKQWLLHEPARQELIVKKVHFIVMCFSQWLRRVAPKIQTQIKFPQLLLFKAVNLNAVRFSLEFLTH